MEWIIVALIVVVVTDLAAYAYIAITRPDMDDVQEWVKQQDYAKEGWYPQRVVRQGDLASELKTVEAYLRDGGVYEAASKKRNEDKLASLEADAAKIRGHLGKAQPEQAHKESATFYFGTFG